MDDGGCGEDQGEPLRLMELQSYGMETKPTTDQSRSVEISLGGN